LPLTVAVPWVGCDTIMIEVIGPPVSFDVTWIVVD
jgi:hypothetical protein